MRFQPSLDKLLHLGDMRGTDLDAGIGNDRAGAAKNDGFVEDFALIFLEVTFQPLAFLDDRFQLGGDLFVVLVLQLGSLLVWSSASFLSRAVLISAILELMTAGLFAFGNGDLILEALEGFLAGILVHITDDVLGEVQHPVQVAAGDIQQHAQVGRDAARVPDVGDRSSQHDMTHALAAHGRAGYFHAALIAGDAFIAGIFVFSAVALPVAGGAKDGLAKQARLFPGAGGGS